MKRLMILLLALLLPLASFAEGGDSLAEGYTVQPTATPAPTPELPPLPDDPMLQNLVEIAQRIDLLAENARFMQYYAYGATQERIDAVSWGDHSRPQRVFHLGGQTLIDALYAGADPSQMLDFTRLELRRDLVEELPELLWGVREETELSLLSLLWRFKVFAAQEDGGCGLYLLLYENAAPVAVTWVAESGCVKMSACFMPDEALASAADAQAVSAWFAGQGMPEVAFEEVPLT